MNTGRNFFITGGMGFIGSHIVRKLLEDNHRITVFDSFIQYVEPLEFDNFANPYNRLRDVLEKIEIIRGNLTDVNILREALGKSRPEYVVHLAAMPLANLANVAPEEAKESIISGTANLIYLLRGNSSLKRLVYVSSSMVYGDFETIPVRENSRKEPKSVYGALKLCAEVIVKTYCDLYGIDYVIVRPTAVYGPYDGNKRVIRIFIENTLRGKRIKVKGKDVELDFTYVKDTARGIILAALTPGASGEDFNISRGEGRTLMEAAEIVKSLVADARIECDEKDSSYPKRGAMDILKAKKILGYLPQYSLEEGIKEYFEFLKEHVGDEKR